MNRINQIELGFWETLFAVASSAMTADSVIRMIQKPKVSYTEIPGVVGLREIEPEVAEAIEKSRAELEALHAQEIELAKKQEELEAAIARKEALKQGIIKLAPLVVLGGVGLAIYLLWRKR